MKAEWKKRAFFADIAEVLKVETTYILSAHYTGDRLLVFYTPHYEQGDNTIWQAWLKPDGEGILQLDSVPRAKPGMYEELKKNIEEGFGDE